MIESSKSDVSFRIQKETCKIELLRITIGANVKMWKLVDFLLTELNRKWCVQNDIPSNSLTQNKYLFKLSHCFYASWKLNRCVAWQQFGMIRAIFSRKKIAGKFCDFFVPLLILRMKDMNHATKLPIQMQNWPEQFLDQHKFTHTHTHT